MNVEDFHFFATDILGSETNWVEGIARKLGVDATTVQGWLEEDRLPDWIERRLADLIIGRRERPELPDDAWIVGTSPTEPERRYLVHLHPPRFVARIVSGSEPRPAGARRHGQSWRIDDGRVLDDVVWIDPPPGNDTDRLMMRAVEVARNVGTDTGQRKT
ncbi:MAG: hypothetical protein EA356_17740 [Geminicoccaceae bacterium]|nr:MAG: hypothetical protein EA356_17740 [Geminicoccaceae bacterium]